MDVNPTVGKGCVIWLTGLPGAGKTTLARLVEKELSEKHPAEVLDGDDVRKTLTAEFRY